MKRFATTLIFIFGLMSLALPSYAQQESVFTIHTNAPVAVPGHVLPPGDYVFRLIETETYPHVVEVMSADRSSLYGLYQVAPAERAEPSESLVTLTSPDAAGVQGISEWYFPGTMDGYQFLYSKKDIQKEDQMARRLPNQFGSGL